MGTRANYVPTRPTVRHQPSLDNPPAARGKVRPVPRPGRNRHGKKEG